MTLLAIQSQAQYPSDGTLVSYNGFSSFEAVLDAYRQPKPYGPVPGSRSIDGLCCDQHGQQLLQVVADEIIQPIR